MDSPMSDLVGRPHAYQRHSRGAIAVWVVTVVTATVFIAAAIPTLGGYGFLDTRFRQWGYPNWFEMVVGIVEVVSSVFLILPITAIYAACVLAAVMVGAIFTHLVFGQAVLAVVPAVMLCLVGFIGWTRRPNRWRSRHARRAPEADQRARRR